MVAASILNTDLQVDGEGKVASCGEKAPETEQTEMLQDEVYWALHFGRSESREPD